MERGQKSIVPASPPPKKAAYFGRTPYTADKEWEKIFRSWGQYVKAAIDHERSINSEWKLDNKYAKSDEWFQKIQLQRKLRKRVKRRKT